MRIGFALVLTLLATVLGTSKLDELRFSRKAWVLAGLPVESKAGIIELQERLSRNYKIDTNESEFVQFLEEQGFERRTLNDDATVMTLTRESFFCRHSWSVSWRSRLGLIATTPEVFIAPGCK
jgi:hypothetical protein